jgi:phosphoribosylamine--glycine ligase
MYDRAACVSTVKRGERGETFMKVLVIGSGGREHALCWAIAKSPGCDELYCAPGNAGIDQVAITVPNAVDDLDGIMEFVSENGVNFVIVGPEGPLVEGLVDRLEEAGIPAFGPNARAAEFEGSKGLTKDLCAKYLIPTAEYARFDEPDAAKEYIRVQGAPIVVKADGLAAGKGVILCRNVNEAYAAIDHIMTESAFGDAGAEVVIEELLTGEEASFFALVDGKTALPLVAAQDHKAVFDGDEGPNTGGMGAYSPAPVVTDELAKHVMDEIITPTIRGAAAEGRPYKGVLYAGLMITEEGPKLIEYNVRFGDPECQPMMMRLKSDALEMLLACAEGRLDEYDIQWHDAAALCVVMATEGYPGAYEGGSEIRGLDKAGALKDVVIFHAGTADNDGRIVAAGGRVLNVTALGKTVKAAKKRAYEAVDLIDWPEGFCRSDIGWRAAGD